MDLIRNGECLQWWVSVDAVVLPMQASQLPRCLEGWVQRLEMYERAKYNREVPDQHLPFCPEQCASGRLRMLTSGVFYFPVVIICRTECLHASSWEGDGCCSKNGATMRKRPEGIAREIRCSVKQLTFTKQEKSIYKTILWICNLKFLCFTSQYFKKRLWR